MNNFNLKKIKPVLMLVVLFLFSNIVSAQNNQSSIKEIGIILNTVGDEMNEDYVSTLKKLKEMGYSYIEGGYYGEDAGSYFKLLSDLGLKSIAYGSNLEGLLNDLDTHIKTAKSLHAPYLVCYFPWDYEWEKRSELVTKEGAVKAAEQLNSIGEKCKEAGMKFVWHNHDVEFVILEDGSTPFDIIMENTNPEFVSVQLDVYWTTKGGSDPVKQIEKYSGRIPLLHIKDMADKMEKGFACAGEGVLDFEKIINAANENGVKHCIIEHDDPADGISCAQVGYTTINKLITKL